MIGPADHGSELIEAKLAFDRGRGVVFKPIRGIQFVVAEKLPCGAMNAVGARLDGCVHDSASGAAQFGAEVRGLNLEFLNRIDRRQDDEVGSVQEVDCVGVVVDAVQQVVVLRGTQTIRGKCAGSRIAARIRLRRLHARAELSKESEVAAVERKRVHFLLADHLADRRLFGLQQRRRGVHFDCFCRGTELKLHVDLKELRNVYSQRSFAWF